MRRDIESDLDFYTRRAGEELRAVAEAACPEAQQRHRMLAEQYALLVEEQARKSGGEACEDA